MKDINIARQIHSDIMIGNLEKNLGIPVGSIRHPYGRDMRGDKKLGSLRRELEKTKKAK